MLSINRRCFSSQMIGAMGAAFAVHLGMSPTFSFADEMTMEQWMEEWIKGIKQLRGALHVSRFVEPVYFLTKEIAWKPGAGQESLAPVNVPIGFVTDFASIPRVFWTMLRPDGEYTYAAIVHDFLYWTQDRSRAEADKVLKAAMQDLSIDTITVKAVYSAVRVGAGSAWDNNARAKAAGEKRILKVFPEDPTTRWENWKKIPDVFA